MALHKVSCLILLLLYVATSAEKKTYRAATVEFEPYFQEHIKPTDLLVANAEKQAEYVTKAAEQNADIIIFPEYGIATLEDVGINYTRENFLPYFQDVPDPQKVSWNPCLNPHEYEQTEALHVLSCSARNNSVAVLTNILSKEDCNKQNDPNCPSDGHYGYNTNVVFDKNGTLIARYHKKHLFTEDLLNSPKKAEYVIFNINGVDFASFICFDIIYKDPAVELVRNLGIKNLIFSTAWINEMPFLLGPQLYSRWARGLGANLIVTNYYKPQYTRLGTGIYSSQLGALNETFDISRKGTLLTADLPIDPSPVPKETTCLPPIQSDQSTQNTNTNQSYVRSILTDKPSSKPVEPIHKIYYQSLVNFTALYLKESQGNVTLCQKGVCCNLVYSISIKDDQGVYALLAFDGIHHFSWYRLGMQTCSVMRCEKENDIETCGRVPKTTATAEFDQLSLVGQLEGDIFPSVLQTNLQLLPAQDWSYSLTKCGDKSEAIIELNKERKSVLVASLYARLYNRDFEIANEFI